LFPFPDLLLNGCTSLYKLWFLNITIYNRLQCNQKTILEPLVDDLLGLRHLQEQKYKKRLALGEDIQHLAKQKHNLTRIHTLGYIEEPQFLEVFYSDYMPIAEKFLSHTERFSVSSSMKYLCTSFSAVCNVSGTA